MRVRPLQLGLCLALMFGLGIGCGACDDEPRTRNGSSDDGSGGGGDAGLDATEEAGGGGGQDGFCTTEVCNGLDDDCNDVVDDVAPELPQLQHDALNCGACGNRCRAPNAQPVCREGECGFVCNPNWSDIDGDPDNGCEILCELTNGGVEVCDGVDNDCNDEIDETFDLYTDVDNCGECGHRCELPGVTVHACEVGDCVAVECANGFLDLNVDGADGCEYACVAPPDAVEVCDGVDNDCDGLVDGDDPVPPQPNFSCANVGVCVGVRPMCSEGTWSCAYPERHYTAGQETMCDGRDNDCDGEIDEDFVGKGDPCSRGHGACRGQGVWECTPDGRALRCTAEDHPELASVETCNGRDDDCDGRVDNDVIDLEWVQVAGFRIFKYEASRPGAQVDFAGNLDGRACSRPGVLPWADATFEQASVACALGGWRVCTLAEWRLACGGVATKRFPYGNDFDPRACNGHGHGSGEPIPSGQLDGTCEERDYGASDMSGNLKEWTATAANEDEDVHLVVGGAYDNRMEESLSCQGLGVPREDVFHFANLGFRCCTGQ